jgi:hypothetical protein
VCGGGVVEFGDQAGPRFSGHVAVHLALAVLHKGEPWGVKTGKLRGDGATHHTPAFRSQKQLLFYFSLKFVQLGATTTKRQPILKENRLQNLLTHNASGFPRE